MNAETAKRNPLGRGLNALFGDQPDDAQAAPEPVSRTAAQRVPIHLLMPSPLQPRRHFDEAALDELAQSIRERDILQPIIVRSAAEPGRYEIVAGERRWRAAQKAMLHDVPVIVRDMPDDQVLELALIENLQRADLSPVEEGRGFKRLMDDFNHTQERVAEIVGKSRAHVANTIRLLTLPEQILSHLESGALSAGQARPLVGLRNATTLAEVVLKRGLNARQVERLARADGITHKKRIGKSAATAEKDADTRALEQTLEKATGYKVDIKFDGEGGTVTMHYQNLEQLDDIVKRFTNATRRPHDAGDDTTEFAIHDPDQASTA